MNQEEQNYLNLLQDILGNGSKRMDRTGVGTLSIFGSRLKFSLENSRIPIFTSKKLFIKGVVEELLFFIRGDTDTKLLEEKGVNIWKNNTSREFLDSRGLQHLPEGSLGKGYGFQWRKFGAYQDDDYEGVDQLDQVLYGLKNDPHSRRHIITAWNPQQLDEMALPPCHMMAQFYVDKGQLSCQFYMRSVDTFLGLPFNIASYALLTHITAKASGLKAKELIFVGGDTHIYLSHLDQVKEQISREPFDFPTLQINKEISTVMDMEKLTIDNFTFNDYACHSAIKAQMAI